MRRHRDRHNKEKKVQCSECGKGFSEKNYLVKHMKIHAGADRKLLQCELCDKKVTGSQSLAIHRRTHTGMYKKCFTIHLLWNKMGITTLSIFLQEKSRTNARYVHMHSPVDAN